MQQRSRLMAQRAVRLAARDSAAYALLLRERGIDPASVSGRSPLDWSALPVLTKSETFGRFPLPDLMRRVSVRALADVLTSSGRGTQEFGLRLTSRRQHDRSWFGTDLGLQETFDVDRRSTLLVNCLPMGVTFASRAVTVANVSVREDMAAAIVRDAGALFEQTIVCTDPLFVRLLLREGLAQRVDWAQRQTSLIVGEEMLTEPQRVYLARRLGIADNDGRRLVGSSFGVGELGLNLMFETRSTIAMRGVLQSRSCSIGARTSERESAAPALFCYDPLRVHIEVVEPDAEGFGSLCFTMLDRKSIIALPRYTTGDVGRLVAATEAQTLAAEAGVARPWLPVVALRGRRTDRPEGLPSVERLKELLYADHALADRLTGAFRLEQDVDGAARVEYLAWHDDPASLARCEIQLRQQAQRAGLGAVRVAVSAMQPNPWNIRLDYERKFAYLARPRREGSAEQPSGGHSPT